MNTDPAEMVNGQLRTLKIIVLALALGVLTFIAVVLIQRQGGAAPAAQISDMITMMGYVMLAMSIVLQPVILPLIDAQIRRQSNQAEPSKWLISAYAARTITGCALIEGASFMCIVGAMMDGQPWGLLAGGLGAAAMIGLHFPSVAKFEAYAERQANKV